MTFVRLKEVDQIMVCKEWVITMQNLEGTGMMVKAVNLRRQEKERQIFQDVENQRNHRQRKKIIRSLRVQGNSSLISCKSTFRI